MERPLFWHQGLLLQPQHFQLQDRCFQSLLTPLHKYLQPYFWGVIQSKIQEAAVGNFSFELLSGDFLFSDMTYIQFPGNAFVESGDFSELWPEGEKPLTVFLGLKKWSDTFENVTIVSDIKDINYSKITTRFITSSGAEEVRDLHQDTPPAQIRRLHYLVRLFFGEKEAKEAENYEVIPIARLERSGEDVIISNSFSPPCVSISASKLLNLIKEVRDQIASRGRQLESYKREKGIHTAQFGARDMVYFLALRTINRYIPVLFHLTESEAAVIHPWNVYALLKQLIGELSSFSVMSNAMGELEDGSTLPSYDHRNLWNCFSEAQSRIAFLLDSITAGPDYVFPLEYDGTYYVTELPPKIFSEKSRFYLVFETERDFHFIRESLDSVAKLSSRESLPLLIAKALYGVKLNYLDSPPQELPRKADASYFQIDHTDDRWRQVERNTNLALYWDTAPKDLNVELMVVERS